MSKKSTELVFILDESGSMYDLKKDTIGGFNSMIDKQKEVKGKCYVTTVLFNSEIKTIHDRVDLEEIKKMSAEDYCPNNTTALMDAIGKTIEHISMIHKYIRKEDIPEKTLFVIMTDGYENASVQYSVRRIKEMITKQKEKYKWEFMFIGANIDAEETANSYGIDKDMAVNYHADSTGSEIVYESINEAVSGLRRNKKINSKWNEAIQKDFKIRTK